LPNIAFGCKIFALLSAGQSAIKERTTPRGGDAVLPTTSGFAVAQNDISALVDSSNNLKLVPSPFEEWASTHGYDTAPAVSPSDIRQYADPYTQAAFDAWNAGAASVARKLTESTLETDPLRELIRELAGLE
jgi:hypothetical protein